jgi:hypothetical protein
LTDRRGLRERQRWIAVTAVLSTALAWLATVNLVLLVNACGGHHPEVFAVLRALTRAALALGRSGGPVAAVALATAALLLALALRPATRPERQTRHA